MVSGKEPPYSRTLNLYALLYAKVQRDNDVATFAEGRDDGGNG